MDFTCGDEVWVKSGFWGSCSSMFGEGGRHGKNRVEKK